MGISLGVGSARVEAGGMQIQAQDSQMIYIIEMFLLASAHKKTLASQTEKAANRE